MESGNYLYKNEWVLYDEINEEMGEQEFKKYNIYTYEEEYLNHEEENIYRQMLENERLHNKGMSFLKASKEICCFLFEDCFKKYK